MSSLAWGGGIQLWGKDVCIYGPRGWVENLEPVMFYIMLDCLQDCMYLHDVGDSAASFTKEDMQQG